MPIHININSLITGSTVEWERIEFKEGWNPEGVIHSICAFANDSHNWGGGYIIIGIGEENGRPILPPKGLTRSEINNIQKELLGLCRRLHPNFYPKIEPVEFQGKLVLVLWVYGGQNRPYRAPKTLQKGSVYSYYIRRFNSTVIARRDEENELIGLTANIPFDDRINHQHELHDLKLPLIQDYLKEIESDLYTVAGEIPFKELCLSMKIAEGPQENLKPKNVGLLFFNDRPETIFGSSYIRLAIFHDGLGGDNITEKMFTGPIHYQINDALNYLNNNIIAEKIVKLPDRAEAIRINNYPFAALEEALVNAIYHRDYEIPEPVEVRVEPDRIEILSYPGPVRSVTHEMFDSGRVTPRRYRNRRIGDFFKALDMTEGLSTGIPKIYQVMERNDSPRPEFEFDEDRSYFITRLLINPEFIKGTVGVPVKRPAGGQVKGQVRGQVDKVNLTRLINEDDLNSIKKNKIYQNIIKIISRNALTATSIAGKVGVGKSGFFRRSLSNLVDIKVIEYTIPEKPRSRNQQYRITELGRMVLEYLNKEAQDDE